MKKKLSIILAVVLTATLLLPSLTFAHVGHKTIEYYYWSKKVSNWLEMEHYCGSETRGCCGGPASGVSIGRYYKTRPLEYYDNNYGDLPAPYYMYWDLYGYMNTFGCLTDFDDYGPGFVDMTEDPDNGDYDNFSYVNDYVVTDADYNNIVNAIDNGWPVALMGNFASVHEISGDPPGGNDWPPLFTHYIAIKGYSYWQALWPLGQPPTDRRIRCTDNWCKADNLWLSWDEVIDEGAYLKIIIIKDS